MADAQRADGCVFQTWGFDVAVDEGKLNELLGRFVTDIGGSFHARPPVVT
jgi:hypothetical protein